MRLTKMVIDSIAETLVEPAIEKRKLIEKERTETIRGHILTLVPPEVDAIFKTHRSFINRRSYFSIQYLGKWSEVRFEKPIPHDDAKSCIVLPHVLGQYITDLDCKIKKANEAISKMEENLKATLKALGTYQRVRESFPEAAALLPKEVKVAVPAINIKEIQLNLKKIS